MQRDRVGAGAETTDFIAFGGGTLAQVRGGVVTFTYVDHLGTPVRTALLPWEDRDAFETLHADCVLVYLPTGPAESSLVEQQAWTDWRRRRLWLGERALHMVGVERATSGEEHDRLTWRAVRLQPRAESPDPERMILLLNPDKLDGRLTRQFEKVLSMMIRLQDVREASANLPAR